MPLRAATEARLAHTIEHPLYAWMKLDGVLASEFSMNALWAAAMGVPSVFLSGDRFICESAEACCPGIRTYATKDCIGSAVWGLHPDEAVEGIYTGVLEALAQPHSRKLLIRAMRSHWIRLSITTTPLCIPISTVQIMFGKNRNV